MLQVVDVAEFYAPQGGGVRSYIEQKWAAAAALGVDLTVIAPGPRDDCAARAGGRLITLAGPPERFDPRYHRFGSARAIHAVLDARRPAVVEASSPWAGGAAVASWQGAAVKALILHQDPVAVYGHSLFDRWLDPATIDRLAAPLWRRLRRLAGACATTVVAGPSLARRMAAQGLPGVACVPFGVDAAPFAPDLRDAGTRADLLRACGQDEDATLMVAVARHHPEKRLGTLIDTTRLLNRPGTGDAGRGFGLVIFGDGPLRPWVTRTARRVPQVHLAGRLADRHALARALASADLMLHGGAAETFGLAMGEALRVGLPLVVPARGGAADLADPAWAETYPPGDAAGAAAAVRRLTARPQAPLRAAAVAAGARLPTPADHFAALFAHYRTLLAQVGRAE